MSSPVIEVEEPRRTYFPFITTLHLCYYSIEHVNHVPYLVG